MIQIRLKPVTSELVGLDEKITKILRRELTYENKNAKYMPNPWMGRDCLLKVAGAKFTVPTGLVPRVIRKITEEGSDYQLINLLPVWQKDPELHYFNDQKFTLRPYQVTAAMAAIKTNFGCGVFKMATGSGKTPTMVKLIQLLQVKTLIVIDTKDLMYQTMNTLTQFLKCPIGQIGDGICNTHDITVATYQSIVQAYEGKKLIGAGEIKACVENAELVVYDECHMAACKSIQTIQRNTKKVVRTIGMSASPWRDDGLDLLMEGIVGEVLVNVSASQLIKQKYLVPAEINVQILDAPAAGDMTPMHYSDAPDQVYAAWVIGDIKRHSYVAELAQNHMAQKESVLILVKSLDHGSLLESMIPGSVFMQGKLTAKQRKEILENTRSGKIKCLIATSLADKGLDIPILSVLILAGAGASSTKALQRLGRILRLYPAKDQELYPGTVVKTRAKIYDLVDACSTFRNQYYERQTIYHLEDEFQITKNKVSIH